jgi:ABC-type bacteriocin/lantibiotic exporter with double-glycine peptidase domain
MRSLLSVYGLLTVSERTKLGILVILTAFGGFVEVFGIGVLFPYVVILQDPGRILQIEYLAIIYRWLNFTSERSFLITMSVGLLVLFSFKALFTLMLANLQLKFVYDVQTQTGRRLLARYVGGPYEFFLSSNIANLIGTLTTSVGQMCSGVIQAALILAAEGVSFLGLVAFVVWLSPAFSLIAFVIIGAMGFAFLGLVRNKIARYAKENDARWKGMMRRVNETLSAAKEIQVLGRAQFFVEAYTRESRAYASAVRHYSVLSQLPRVALETSAIALLVTFAAFTIAAGQMEREIFPVLAVFAAATVRIAPSVNRIIQSWNAISFFSPAVDIVIGGIGSGVTGDQANDGVHSTPDNRMAPHQRFRLNIASFSYGGNPHFRLTDIELAVNRGEKVAIVGPSGSGKSTLMDVLLGLFPGFDGDLIVDGIDCRGNIQAWQRSVGYIPQNVYLLDDSIKRNVAFGIEDSDIDLAAVMRAVSLAGLERVVKTQASGLETVIGDRGIRLSGGERQRIGIARALYHDPSLLILDEATSALDNQTERQVVDSILALSPAKTVIIIAHRLSSVRLCDRVHLMNAGRIVDTGSFEDIAKRHPDFVNPRSTIDGEAHADTEAK